VNAPIFGVHRSQLGRGNAGPRILDGESPQLVTTSLQLPGPPAGAILTICREFEP